MNCETTLTRSQQRIQQLINIGRPLTDEESDELYRALHADYVWRWKRAKRELQAAEFPGDTVERYPGRTKLLEKLRKEARRLEMHRG